MQLNDILSYLKADIIPVMAMHPNDVLKPNTLCEGVPAVFGITHLSRIFGLGLHQCFKSQLTSTRTFSKVFLSTPWADEVEQYVFKTEDVHELCWILRELSHDWIVLRSGEAFPLLMSGSMEFFPQMVATSMQARWLEDWWRMLVDGGIKISLIRGDTPVGHHIVVDVSGCIMVTRDAVDIPLTSTEGYDPLFSMCGTDPVADNAPCYSMHNYVRALHLTDAQGVAVVPRAVRAERIETRSKRTNFVRTTLLRAFLLDPTLIHHSEPEDTAHKLDVAVIEALARIEESKIRDAYLHLTYVTNRSKRIPGEPNIIVSTPTTRKFKTV